MLVHNDTKKPRHVGGKLLHPGETREVDLPGCSGGGVRTLSSIMEPPAASAPPKQYPRNARDTIIDISEMDDLAALEEILGNDDRTTVIKATEARIAELKG